MYVYDQKWGASKKHGLKLFEDNNIGMNHRNYARGVNFKEN